jgi:glycosyltransferase involved in cell wall biosynthesis
MRREYWSTPRLLRSRHFRGIIRWDSGNICQKKKVLMPIYIDISSAVHAKAGIGRYAESLAQALIAREPGRFALFYNRVKGSRPPQSLAMVPARSVRAGYKPWRMAVWVGQLASAGFNRLVPDAELFHATEHLLPPLRGVPTVLTVHDMIFRQFPEHQKRLNYWYLNATMPLYCRRADAILTVSESSKRDIVAHYGLEPAKVTVIYEAAAPEFVPASPAAADAVRRRYGLPARYMLHVGTIEPRKNLTRLVEALDRLHDEGLTIPLVVVGGKGWLYDDFFQRLEALEIRDSVYFPGYVPAADLPLLYSAASLAAMPSVYEGFGLPVLEAMACGTPVVCSQTSSLPELGGTAARYFDPYDVEAMADVIRAVWTDDNMRAEMSRQGLSEAVKFSWSRAAEETYQVYEAILAQRGAR